MAAVPPASSPGARSNAKITAVGSSAPTPIVPVSDSTKSNDGAGVGNSVPPNLVDSGSSTATIYPAVDSHRGSAPIAQPKVSAVGATAKKVTHRVSLFPDFSSSASMSSINNNDCAEEKKEEPSDGVAAIVTKSAPSSTKTTTAVSMSKTTAAAAARVKSKPKPDSTRRSGRKRTSTTMIIDGHTVKTSNNYVVTGDNYIHGAFKADAVKPKKAKPAVKLNDAPKVPRKRAAYLDERQKHNDVIKKKMFRVDNVNRMNFMTNNFDALEPFVDRKVQSHLIANKKHAKPEPDGTDVLGSQPDMVITTLRDYQMIGLDWMSKMHSRGMPFILGDEMGLGKTLQAIALICHLKETDPTFSGPSLVICPLSVLYSWCNEVVKHAPTLKHFRFHASDPKDREVQKMTMLKDILNYDIVITTYEMAKNPVVTSLFRSTYFNLCVLDEGHVIKSLTSQVGEAVRKIHSRGRVILTGTPMQNNLVELYAILNYLYPQYFTTPDKFESAFNITLNQIDPVMLLKANKLLKLFMIRRLKDEVEKLMPKKIETKILCPLSSSQIFWYKGFLMNEIDSIANLMDEESDPDASKGKHQMLRMLIMQLRKVCLHPYLFDFAEGAVKENTSVEELIATSGKLAVLDKLLISLFKNGHRTCIFSQFTSMLNILEDYCILRGWQYCRFDGGTPRAQRNHIINRFNAPGSDDFIFLMSTRSGGLGINLQTADTCILYDSDWNPQPDLQAMARVHRIGQKKTVHIYRMLSAGTVEERIVERAEKKLYLDQMVNRGTSNQGMDEDGTSLSTSELLASLKFGSNAIFASSNDLPTQLDIEKVTDRNRSEECSDGLLKGGLAKTASDFDKDKKLTDTRLFCGVDFRKLREEKDAKSKGKGPKSKFLENLKQDWKEVQTGESEDKLGKGKRIRKSRLLQIEGKGSGWGSSHVPVLALNDYDLLSGEPSAWGREIKKVAVVPMKKKKANQFTNQDFCQFCGDGGTLIQCPRCPVSVHASCCGLGVDEFQCCTHHNCVHCSKNAQGAGGLIYRCQSCPNAYCPDCLPNEPYRHLGKNVPRFEKLGFTGNDRYFYIHCSKQCEDVAIAEFGYKVIKSKPTCPDSINVTYAFGKDALDVKDIAKMFKDKAAGVWQKKKDLPPLPTVAGPTGSRVSHRKRSLTPKASAATGIPGMAVYGSSVPLPPTASDALGCTGYI
mmetsp:Transcript_11410/g.21610  ORF Transcript_11410/g.21610 Transcript_11410/m.21610 type:complete len:1190 (-) Transcript_11410:733-4302(-)|eukprot:CAMPEP_0201661446 /NCGR_PEP_ID=MMETSP0494-20130426/3816_1 /ASSEMBLY_ACC=CAM_ASM_000839 /TAXON_ID=420259 /ORGANISM="Thalassiosira gravida, Strain GMp14c1" /LENGTH=1189 /DNA_ID=CAMNT_0048139559 /DNA_START=132 /DNA_END=3701 /DNA_ORIENTATION=+